MRNVEQLISLSMLLKSSMSRDLSSVVFVFDISNIASWCQSFDLVNDLRKKWLNMTSLSEISARICSRHDLDFSSSKLLSISRDKSRKDDLQMCFRLNSISSFANLLSMSLINIAMSSSLKNSESVVSVTQLKRIASLASLSEYANNVIVILILVL